jgi:ribosomal protein S18 acetylase RimI-like enzyme
VAESTHDILFIFISSYQIQATHNIPIMSFVRPMSPMDLLSFNPCNLDHLTETYNIGFYLEYFTKWPSLCKVVESETGEIEAYSK